MVEKNKTFVSTFLLLGEFLWGVYLQECQVGDYLHVLAASGGEGRGGLKLSKGVYGN